MAPQHFPILNRLLRQDLSCQMHDYWCYWPALLNMWRLTVFQQPLKQNSTCALLHKANPLYFCYLMLVINFGFLLPIRESKPNSLLEPPITSRNTVIFTGYGVRGANRTLNPLRHPSLNRMCMPISPHGHDYSYWINNLFHNSVRIVKRLVML